MVLNALLPCSQPYHFVSLVDVDLEWAGGSSQPPHPHHSPRRRVHPLAGPGFCIVSPRPARNQVAVDDFPDKEGLGRRPTPGQVSRSPAVVLNRLFLGAFMGTATLSLLVPDD